MLAATCANAKDEPEWPQTVGDGIQSHTAVPGRKFTGEALGGGGGEGEDCGEESVGVVQMVGQRDTATHTHSQTHTHTDTATHRHSHTHTHRHTATQPHTHTHA